MRKSMQIFVMLALFISVALNIFAGSYLWVQKSVLSGFSEPGQSHSAIRREKFREMALALSAEGRIVFEDVFVAAMPDIWQARQEMVQQRQKLSDYMKGDGFDPVYFEEQMDDIFAQQSVIQNKIRALFITVMKDLPPEDRIIVTQHFKTMLQNR